MTRYTRVETLVANVLVTALVLAPAAACRGMARFGRWVAARGVPYALFAIFTGLEAMSKWAHARRLRKPVPGAWAAWARRRLAELPAVGGCVAAVVFFASLFYFPAVALGLGAVGALVLAQVRRLQLRRAVA